jgi:Cu2+-exporting ATPase
MSGIGADMKQYSVTGMSCAACQARVEKAVSKVPGVSSCSVSLLTNTMGVEGDADDTAVINAVEKAGYGAASFENHKDDGHSRNTGFAAQEEALKDHETPVLRKRLISSVIFLAALMYISMGCTMFGWPSPPYIGSGAAARSLTEMLLCIMIMIINRHFYTSGFSALMHGSPNMDTLVALGSGASFAYSTAVMYMLAAALESGQQGSVSEYAHGLYFESAAMIVTLITVGKLLESVSKGRTTDALKSLMKIVPKTAVIIQGSDEITVPVENIKPGDIFVVRPGASIPADGTVTDGNAAVDESSLTGESIPVDKAAGDTVSAATINLSGYIKCRADRVGSDTALSRIIQLMSEAAATKAPIAKTADRVSAVFVPAVITISVITAVIWMLAGKDFGYALTRGISVLVISCPCALGLATPVAIMTGSGTGARHGILFKTAAALESAGRTQIIALDKTGTLTSGTPAVTDVIPSEGTDTSVLLATAYSLENKSEHPLAMAITAYCGKGRGIVPADTSDFRVSPGNGLSGTIDGVTAAGGNASFIKHFADIPQQSEAAADLMSKDGKTPIFFAKGGSLLGIICLADTLKADSAMAVSELHKMGIRTVMLTGDNEQTARAIAQKAGIGEVIAGVLPDGKESAVRRLSESGVTAMVGDGINDAPALTRADTGIAVGAGTDVAIDAADIVIMGSSLRDAAAAIRLSRATLRNIHENLFWAFFYNVIGIPLAAGCFIKPFGLTLSPMFGAAAMSLSSFCVVTNALRLNFYNISEGINDKAASYKHKKENMTMKKTLSIEGMMCSHCEMTVKKALEAIPGVENASVSHETGKAEVTLSNDVQDDVLKSAVEARDYKVTGITG